MACLRVGPFRFSEVLGLRDPNRSGIRFGKWCGMRLPRLAATPSLCWVLRVGFLVCQTTGPSQSTTNTTAFANIPSSSLHLSMDRFAQPCRHARFRGQHARPRLLQPHQRGGKPALPLRSPGSLETDQSNSPGERLMAGKGGEKKKQQQLFGGRPEVRDTGRVQANTHFFFFRSLFPGVNLYPDLFSWSFSKLPGFLEERAGRRLGLVAFCINASV